MAAHAFGQEPVQARSRAALATTHWSVVLSARRDSAPKAQQALETLCRTYWLPLYTYVRRNGHRPEDAQDLTQSFFAAFLEKNGVARARREKGWFRSFLLTSLQNFLAHEWEKAHAAKSGSGAPSLPWEHYRWKPSTNLSWIRIFRRTKPSIGVEP